MHILLDIYLEMVPIVQIWVFEVQLRCFWRQLSHLESQMCAPSPPTPTSIWKYALRLKNTVNHLRNEKNSVFCRYIRGNGKFDPSIYTHSIRNAILHHIGTSVLTIFDGVQPTTIWVSPRKIDYSKTCMRFYQEKFIYYNPDILKNVKNYYWL